MMKIARLSAFTVLIASGAAPVCAQTSGSAASPLFIPAGVPALVPEIIPKPLPDPIRAMIERCGGGRALFVGDSVYDVMAAEAAGIDSVAVAFGFLDRPVAALGATHIIDHYDALIPLVQRTG